jgi:hypothetical protein
VLGISLFMGPRKTLSFFASREKLRGTVCFLLGVGLILAKYPLVGFVVECYGILNLFGDFFGAVVGFLGAMPVVGYIYDERGVGLVVDGNWFYRWDPILKGRCGGSLVSPRFLFPL